MKHYLRSMLTLLVLFVVGGVNSNAAEVSIDFTSKGYTNAQQVTSVSSSPITLTLTTGGSNAPKYYTSDNTLRLYSGGTLTVSTSSGNITNVEITSISKGNIDDLSTSTGSYSTSGTTGTWTAGTTSTSSVVFTASATVRMQKITVTYSSGGTSTTTDPEVTLSTTSIAKGGTTKISYPSDLTTISFSSDDASIASVATDGTITGVAAGSTTITASWTATSTYNAGSQTFNVTVTDNGSTITGDAIIFSDDYSSWSNIPSRYSTSASSISMTANDGKSYSFSMTNVIASTNTSTKGYPQLKKNAGTITSPDFGFAYTVTVEYSGEAPTLTNGSNTATGSSGTVTLTITEGTAFTYTAGSNTNTITRITVTPTNVSAVTSPSINPTTNTFTVDQTVTITNNYEGATVYYTTDGSEPSSTNGTAFSSTANGATVTFTVNTTTTVKAIAVATVDGETVSSSVATSVITINHKVGKPTVTSDGAKVTMTATQADGEAATQYIYYTTGNTLVLNSDGSLASSAVQYTSPVALARTTKFHVVAVDADGCTSDTAVYTFTPKVVTLPYNETFQSSTSQEATLGDFTADPTSAANSTPYWRINKNSGSDAITKWGEERQYAYVTGTNSSSIKGSADLISPIMDVNGYKTVEINFSHAGHYFALARTSGTVKSTDDSYCADDYCKMYYCEVTKNADGNFEDGTWHELKIPNWFTEETEYINNKYVGQFPRINAGNIDFPGNVGINSENYVVPTTGYMRIKFTFTKPNSNTKYGTWNIIQFYARGTKDETEDISYEDANISTGGLYTYVTKNPIDWNKTLNNNTKVTNGIRAYKVVKFNKTKALLVQLGNHANNNSNDKAYLNSEDITVAETPVVLQGASGGTYLVIAQSDDQPSKAVGNLLIAAAANGTKPTATQSLYGLKLKDKAEADENLSNYIWRKLTTKETVKNGKAYLNGEDMTTEEITEPTNTVKGIYASFEDLQNATTGIVEVPTTERKSTDGYFYNLQGMRVAHPAHGIYIYNGRKIIIK